MSGVSNRHKMLEKSETSIKNELESEIKKEENLVETKITQLSPWSRFVLFIVLQTFSIILLFIFQFA